MNAQFTITTQAEVRAAFWDSNPDLTCRKTPRGRILSQNSQPADTRQAFVDFVDHLSKDGTISETLADRVTL